MFAPGRILIQQDYWKNQDNLKVIETNSLALKINAQPVMKKTPTPNGIQQTSAPSTNTDESKNKIDFSLFENKNSKY